MTQNRLVCERLALILAEKTLGWTMQINKIPATIVTGFLGSGKTTLLSKILKDAQGKRIAVIVNEFGELDIDAQLIRGCPLECEDEASNAKGIYELSNGCICCTVEEEFYPVMKELVERRADIDHILIETSGLALPKPLVQAFNWPDIKAYCTVDSVITVVDGPAVLDGRFAHNPEQINEQRRQDPSLDHDPSLKELFDDQLSSADLVLVSKSDQLDKSQIDDVNGMINNQLKNGIKLINMHDGDIDTAIVLGIEAATEDRIDHVHTHHDKHHKHGEHHHHAHDDFDSVSVELAQVDSDKLMKLIEQLMAQHTIYRVKGIAAVANKPMRQVIQGVGTRLERYYDRVWHASETPSSRIVLIGKDLNKEKIESVLHQAVA